jgi:hypothetical protein
MGTNPHFTRQAQSCVTPVLLIDGGKLRRLDGAKLGLSIKKKKWKNCSLSQDFPVKKIFQCSLNFAVQYAHSTVS